MIDVSGYEGLYAVTEDGMVWSYRSKRFLTPFQDINGYMKVTLCKNGKCKQYMLHKLVAEAYIPNPTCLSDADHISENKTDCSASNLQWLSHIDNCNRGTRNDRIRSTQGTKVLCIELNRVFDSIRQASNETKSDRDGIKRCCDGKQQISGGYHWEYIERG